MSLKQREVTHSDWDSIKHLYEDVYNKIAPDGFRKAFHMHSDLLGYCLIDESQNIDKIVGFFGCFTYYRKISGIDYKFYNTHTWIVKKNYRQHSIKLLMPYLRLKDGIVTNFTPSLEVYKILKGAKFKETRIDRYSYQVTFLKRIFSLNKILYISSKVDLNIKDKALVDHHLDFKGTRFHQFKLNQQKENFWILTRETNIKHKLIKKINHITKTILKKPLFTNSYKFEIVHYCSNWTLFKEHFNEALILLQRKKVGGLICSKDLLDLPINIRKQEENEFHTYKTPNQLPFRLDLLYSEIFYLDVFNR